MDSTAIIRLRKDEERRIRAGHLWIFSNEIDTSATPLSDFAPGDPVEVHDHRGGRVGSGYVNPHSLIAVRLFTRGTSMPAIEDLLRDRLRRALSLRDRLFPGEPFYRLIFGEGDGLPGLVVDRFDDVLVAQITTAGMERLQEPVVGLLAELTNPAGILLRSDSSARSLEGLDLHVTPALGTVPDIVTLRENGALFHAPIMSGQKTGWFFDHRMNRERLRTYAPHGRVLDVFSYVGGWGIQAAAFGAREVVCVDSSEAALRILSENAALNAVADRLRTLQGDAFQLLQELRERGERFDVVVLDPPAFIKRKKDLKEGEQAYRRLNRLGAELLAPEGILVSASCSFHMTRDSLLRAVLWGATQAGRELQILEEGHQGPDHPVHPAIPETQYLKTFFGRALD